MEAKNTLKYEELSENTEYSGDKDGFGDVDTDSDLPIENKTVESNVTKPPSQEEENEKIKSTPSLQQQDKIKPGPNLEQQDKIKPGPSLEQQDKIKPGPSLKQQDKIKPGPSLKQDKIKPGPSLEQQDKKIKSRRNPGSYDSSSSPEVMGIAVTSERSKKYMKVGANLLFFPKANYCQEPCTDKDRSSYEERIEVENGIEKLVLNEGNSVLNGQNPVLNSEVTVPNGDNPILNIENTILNGENRVLNDDNSVLIDEAPLTRFGESVISEIHFVHPADECGILNEDNSVFNLGVPIFDEEIPVNAEEIVKQQDFLGPNESIALEIPVPSEYSSSDFSNKRKRYRSSSQGSRFKRGNYELAQDNGTNSANSEGFSNDRKRPNSDDQEGSAKRLRARNTRQNNTRDSESDTNGSREDSSPRPAQNQKTKRRKKASDRVVSGENMLVDSTDSSDPEKTLYRSDHKRYLYELGLTTKSCARCRKKETINYENSTLNSEISECTDANGEPETPQLPRLPNEPGSPTPKSPKELPKDPEYSKTP